jgi:hypothetical protein
VLGQALVGHVRLVREDQVGQLAFEATAGHGQTVPADLAGRMTVAQVEAGALLIRLVLAVYAMVFFSPGEKP